MLHGQDLMEQRLIRDRIDALLAERDRDRLARQGGGESGRPGFLATLRARLERLRTALRRTPRSPRPVGCCDADPVSSRIAVDARGS